MPIPTRYAKEDDIRLDFDGRPALVMVSFFYRLEATQFQGCGWRRPRKKRGVWVVQRYSDIPLRVRRDLTIGGNDVFVAEPGGIKV